MTVNEFNVIASSLLALLQRFYVKYSSKITYEQQKARIEEAQLVTFNKARIEYGKLLDENQKQV